MWWRISRASPSEEFLRSTASVRHGELDDLDRSQAALRDQLQRSISGADQGTQAAHAQLAEAVLRYRGDGTPGTGVIERTRADIERMRSDLIAGETALAQLERDRTALALAHDRRADLDTRLAHDQEQVEMAERAARLRASPRPRRRHATCACARPWSSRPASRPESEATRCRCRSRSCATGPDASRSSSSRSGTGGRLRLRFDGPTEKPKVIRPPRWQPVALGAMVALVAAVALAGAGLVANVLPAMWVCWRRACCSASLSCSVPAIRMARRVRLVKVQAQMQAAEIDRQAPGPGPG